MKKILRNPIVLACLLAASVGAVSMTATTMVRSGRTRAITKSPDADSPSTTPRDNGQSLAANGIFQIAEGGEPCGVVAVKDPTTDHPERIPLRRHRIAATRIRNIVTIPFTGKRAFHVWFEVRGLFITLPTRHLAIVDHGIVRYTARAVTLGSLWRIEAILTRDEVLDVRRRLMQDRLVRDRE